MMQWDLLSKLFTVLIEMDEHGLARRLSPFISHRVPNFPDEELSFFEDFHFKRPARFKGLTAEALATNGRLFLAYSDRFKIAIRGQIIESDETSGAFFVGVPWMAWMRENYPESEPQFSDFPVHDSQMDQLLLLSSQQTMVEDLQQLNDDLEQAKTTVESQGEVRQQFFNRVSHEVRTPLMGVSSALTLLQDRIDSPDEVNLLSMAEASIDRATEVVNFALGNAASPQHSLENLTVATDLKQLVGGVEILFQATAIEKGLELKTTLDEALAPQYWCADLLLKEVLINLLGNAIKFTQQGSIHVDVALLPTSVAEEHALLFQVADTGPGIPVDLRRQIFLPFETGVTNETRGDGGTGLGLSSSESQVKAMGGSIAVSESRTGGALFTVSLPLRPCSEDTVSEMRPEESVDHYFSHRLLLLDDSATNLSLNAEVLRSLGFVVTTATTGAEAIEAARLSVEPFHAALLDINLPDMTGYQVAEQIHALPNCADMVLVALSAYSQRDEKQKAYESGMTAFVTKPFKRRAIAAELRQLLDPLAGDSSDDGLEDIASHESFDSVPVREMLDLLGIDTVCVIGESLRDEGKQNIEAMCAALARGDLESAEREAHTLGSSSRALGLMSLSNEMRSIEAAIDSLQTPSSQTISRVKLLFDAGLSDFEDYLSRVKD